MCSLVWKKNIWVCADLTGWEEHRTGGLAAKLSDDTRGRIDALANKLQKKGEEDPNFLTMFGNA